MPGLVCSFEKHPTTRISINCTAADKPCRFNDTHCCRACFEQAKLDWDATYKADCAACDACPDCQRVRQAAFERDQRSDTIDPGTCWGQHIVLSCRDHQHLRWSTKNIGYIGARSIFFSSHDTTTECSCSMNRLFSPGRLLNHLIRLYGGDPLYTGKD